MILLPIFLPQGSLPKVSVKDKITAGQVIAEKQSVKKDYIIHLTKDFGISAGKIQKSLKKNLGDSVEEGTVIAEKKKVLGKENIKSPISGIIAKIDEENGDIYIKTLNQEKGDAIISPVDGVIDFCNNEKIVIKTEKDVVIASDAFGQERMGELLLIEELDTYKLTNKIENKAILTKSIDKISLFKAIGLEAAGIITLELFGEDFIDFEEKPIKTPVMIVNEEDFKKLTKHNKDKIYMDTKNKSIIVL